MSLINNQFLSLTNRLYAQFKVQKEKAAQEEQKQEVKEDPAQTLMKYLDIQESIASPNINNNLLLTYRGININHIETAQTKQTVAYSNSDKTLNNPLKAPVYEVQAAQVEIKEEPKPATVNNSVVNSSSIASEYQSNTVKTGIKGLKTSTKLDAITDMARADLNSVAEAIKAQLKEELGSQYNSKEVQAAIDSAIEQTLQLFRDNDKKSKTEPNNNEQAFVFKRGKSFLSITGTYTYNLQALTNTFLERYNSITTDKFNDAQKTKDPGTVGQSVIQSSNIAHSYNTNEQKSTTSIFKIKAQNEAKEMAKSDLESVSAEIKKQLQTELGANYDDAAVSASINEAIEKTIDQFVKNSGNDVDNSFQFKRKSIFKQSCSYNVKNLVNTFLENFNTVNAKKFSNINNNTTVSDEVKTQYTNKYQTEMTGEMLRANLDAVLKSTTEENSVDSQMLYIKAGSSQELKATVGEKIDNTYALYEERLGSAFENKAELKALFAEAKESVLNSLDGQNKCNLGEISYELENKFFENINTNLWNKYQTENAQQQAPMTRSMFAAASSPVAATRSISSNNAGNVSVSTDSIKFQNGMIVTDPKDYPATIDITINNADGTSSTVNVKVEPDLLIYKPLKENTDEVTVVDPFADWNSRPQQERLNEIADNLKQTFQNLPESVLKDFISEGTSISVTPAGDDIYSSKNLGLYSPAINQIALTYGPGHGTGFLNGINVNTLTHEIGHTIDVQEGVYKSDSSTTNLSAAYNNLLNALPESMRNNYALSNPKELFAEYYAYTNLGTSDHFSSLISDIKSKGLYDKIKPLIENIDKEFKGILKTDASIKEAQDKAQSGNYTNAELLDKIKQDWENGKIYTSDLVGNNWSDINDTWNLNMQTKDILAEYYKHYYLNEPSDLINRLNNATGNTKYGDSIKELWNAAVKGSEYSDGLKQTCEKFKESLTPSANVSPDYGNTDYDNSDNDQFDDSLPDYSQDETPPTDFNENPNEFEPDYSDNENIETDTDSSEDSSNTGSGIPDDFNPQPDFPDNTPNNNDSNDFEVITGTIDNAGLDAGIVPDINQNEGDGAGFNSSYSQEQLDQIHDYVQDQLEQQYGDGYQIDVTVDSFGNASYHIMNDLDGSPVGDITGGSGLINNDSKYDENGFDENGYDKDGYDQNGFDADGYNQWGFDENGYDRDGYDEWGYDEDGYDENGYNIDGYDEDGYDKYGFDEDGYDIDGYDEDGYNQWGFDEDGFDREGYDEWGFDEDGFDKNGYDIDGYDRDGNNPDDYFDDEYEDYYGANDDYISQIPAFGTQGSPIFDYYGNIIGYQ